MFKKTALFILVITICGCAALRQFVQTPSIHFENMSVQDMSLFEGKLLFKFNVTNPNPVGAPITRMAYNLKLHGKEFIKDTVTNNIMLPGSGSTLVEIPVTINYIDFFESVAKSVETDTVAYDFSGSLGVGPLDIPYQTSGDFPVPSLPKISLENIKVSNLTLTGASVLFSLNMENLNPFTVNLSGLDYNIRLAGSKFADGTVQNLPSIAEKSKAVIKIPMNLNFFDMARSVQNFLRKSSTEYELSGNMKFRIPEVGEKSLPFHRIGNVPLK